MIHPRLHRTPPPCAYSGSRVQGSGFRFQVLGFRFGVQGLGFRVQVLEFGGWELRGLGSRDKVKVQGSGFRR